MWCLLIMLKKKKKRHYASNLLLQAFTDEARGMQVTPAVAAKDQLNARVHQPHPDNETRPGRHQNHTVRAWPISLAISQVHVISSHLPTSFI